MSYYMYSCPRDKIDPSINLPDIARDIISMQRELSNLWQEYMDAAILVGMVDMNESDETIKDYLTDNIDIVAEEGHSMINSFPGEISWLEQYGEPKSYHYPREGAITYTIDSGETFEEN